MQTRPLFLALEPSSRHVDRHVLTVLPAGLLKLCRERVSEEAFWAHDQAHGTTLEMQW